ncbi:hypothetical protein QNI16_11215 [Cytophagaceae bacterium YF14B1]|uniref:DUF3429 domain-containing protein n=2 Tax=Xanthocytophaga flava TaxID=3048013 RepID=A0AAE3U8U2_9BACT|nr:hypothetical protein [Xanthocytophaga flavus]MDJ1481054.1 hypothetical protein [Xanthocytophaga flavus]
MMNYSKQIRPYLSLVLLFMPALLFALLLIVFRNHSILHIQGAFPFLPWQFWIIGIFGVIATAGGVLDWKYHRNPLQLKLSKKERDAEAAALGLGGLPMFVLMWLAMMHAKPTQFLIPILVVLIYTIVAICYDEFVFHRKRCGKLETIYHRMLVLGNGIAWLAWFHFIFC